MAQKIRSPICTVVGHVDHGKSSILDKIRGSAIVAQEAGGITQAIGASIIPLPTIKKICGPLLDDLKINFTIPGLLFIDTPGHAAFTNLRKRGGNLADIAILVVDINEGFKPQTVESVEILKSYKTPFVVAANKIDLIKGWRSDSSKKILENAQGQSEHVMADFEKKLYALVSSLSEMGFNSDRFDRVNDFTKQIAIIPCSAKTGEGIPELLMVISGLAQKYLGDKLACSLTGAKGTILEVKEEKGLGKTMDVILYDGCIKIGDTIVIGGLEAPIVARVRALFEPAPLTEMRGEKTKFRPVKEATAATGIKISAPGAEEAVAGMPVIAVAKENIESAKREAQKSVEEVTLQTDEEGVVIKADNLGSLEALSKVLRDKGVGIIKASIGIITKKDISDAESNLQKNPLNAAVLGFNVEADPSISSRAKIITSKIIYKLIDDFEEWQAGQKRKMEEDKLGLVVRPCKIQILTGYVFRQSNPAVVGCEVLEGEARTGTPIMNSAGKSITAIKQIQAEKENLTTAQKGMRVAMSFENVTVGRQVHEGDVLYSDISEDDFRQMKGLSQYLSKGEIQVLKEIAEMKRRSNPVWGI
jgi:translation initiation factor 5B